MLLEWLGKVGELGLAMAGERSLGERKKNSGLLNLDSTVQIVTVVLLQE